MVPDNRRFLANSRKLFESSRGKVCLLDECSEPAIGAHSIQRSQVLKSIAENRHVLMIKPSVYKPVD